MQSPQEKGKQAEGMNGEKFTIDTVERKGRGDWSEDRGIRQYRLFLMI